MGPKTEPVPCICLRDARYDDVHVYLPSAAPIVQSGGMLRYRYRIVSYIYTNDPCDHLVLCRRHVTGDGIGGLPGPAQSSPDQPFAGHSPAVSGAGSGDGIPSNVDTSGEIVPEGGAEEEGLFAAEEEEEEAEEGEDEDEGEEDVEVAPSSSRRKRHKM